MFELGEFYTRDEIHSQVGGSVQSYLPTSGGRIVAVCLNVILNPDAPHVILPGRGPVIRKTADQFTRQGDAVPTFIKKDVNRWEYVGKYRVKRQSHDKEDQAGHVQHGASGRRQCFDQVDNSVHVRNQLQKTQHPDHAQHQPDHP